MKLRLYPSSALPIDQCISSFIYYLNISIILFLLLKDISFPLILTKHSAKCTKIQYFGKVKCQLLTYYLKHFQEAEIVMRENLCKMCSYQQNHKISNQFIKSPGNLQYLGTFRFNSNNMRKCIGTIEGEISFIPIHRFWEKHFIHFLEPE